MNIKSNKGVTLTILIITMVVMLIIAGTSIKMIFDHEGLIRSSKRTQEEQKNYANNEETKTNSLINDIENEMRYAIKGIIVKNGNKEYIDIDGNKAIIPEGFCVVKDSNENINKIANGLVISDIPGDDLNNSKGGNQFVWVPVDGNELKYEKHVYAEAITEDHKDIIEDTENGGWKTYQYKKYSDWADDKVNTESVAKYKGFYIGRFEAGVPTDAPFFSDKEGDVYWQQDLKNNDLGTNNEKETDNSNNKNYADTYTEDKNKKTYKPVSKKNNIAWNYISQTSAIKVSKNMYNTSMSVTSSLIDSYAWDTVSQWLSNSSYDVKSSTSWGNYYDASFEINGLYAMHQNKAGTDGKIRLYPAYTWSYGAYTKSNSKETEIVAGSLERNIAKNIYDFAGNMYEWTTETRTGNRIDWNATNSTESTTSTSIFAVTRGGGFLKSGTKFSASSRNGYYEADKTYLDVGFRVVLYIN